MMLEIEAPAKINLTLEVLQKRVDGYHEIRSVLQAVSLCDSLSFEAAEGIVFNCDDPSWQAGKSLVSRAVASLMRRTNSSRGTLINIAKRIPLSSGLGGDSSDAAAVLRGLNQLWKLGIPPGEMVRMAGDLGSDVPFFLSGGTALAQGRGEFISPLPSMTRAWLILLMPPIRRPESKTGALYFLLQPEHFTSGAKTDDMVELLTLGKRVGPDNLFNVFEKVAFTAFNGLEKYRDTFQKATAEAVHLAGSGPALYALFSDRTMATGVYNTLKLKGFEVYLAETLSSLTM